MKQWQTVLILAVLAIGSFILLRDLENSLTLDDADTEVKELAVGLDIKGKFYNAKNQLQFDIVGDKITEYSNGGGSKITMAKMRAFDEATLKLAWEGEAELAQISADKKELTLNDDVELIQAPESDNPMYATGDHIVYFTDTKKILGDKPIVLENNEMRHTGRQFNMNLNDGKAHFAGGMHGYFLPSTADFGAVLPGRVAKKGRKQKNKSKNTTTRAPALATTDTRISASNLAYFHQIEQGLPVTLAATQTAKTLQAPIPDEAKVSIIQALTPDDAKVSIIQGLRPDVATVSSIDQLKPDSAIVSRLKMLTPDSASTGRRLKTLIPDRVTTLKVKTFVPETNTDVFSSESMPLNNANIPNIVIPDANFDLNRVSGNLNLVPIAPASKIDFQSLGTATDTTPSNSNTSTFISSDIALESAITPNYLEKQSFVEIDLDKAYIESLRSEQVIQYKGLLEIDLETIGNK